ncbi:PTS ascorbate transporter subunit IIC [Thermoanaerobacterium thermosaccharolyticum]|uniref:PTS ascorbate transporter subunit IIC n=1 Tax=Thermoanaerobacterium thermosaccharolyticum TaxID=1517 RepID=UPI0020A4D539|nr:PTS ascorbate transporter subunit IIC [Thermoanaerobacterium thermosaccharolyticum]MCP2240272.1 PTS system ascorbate-specific IIC component [Thermoanaerobacterium thermosaccharolyticum]
MQVLNFIVTQIFQQPAIFMALIALIGLILQRKSFSDTLKGTLKTAIGLLIMTSAANIITNTVNPLATIFNHIYGISQVNNTGIGTNEVITKYGSVIGIVMLGAFIINILVAKFTKLKYVWLTGHLLFWMSFVWVAVLVDAGVKGAALIVFGIILMGLYITFMPALAQPFVRKITGGNTFAYGHTSTIGAVLGGYIGGLLGNKKNDTENIKISDSLDFFRDVTISTGLVMTVVYLIAVLIAGPNFVEQKISNGQNFIIYALIQGLTFGAGITVLLTGVRMFIAEIVPAFRGITMKWIPNAIPALDCPMIFPYAPTAVMVGFITSLIVGIISIFILGFTGYPWVVLPAMIPFFFDGGPAGVFGNSTGGLRGAIIGGIIAGLIIIFGQAFVLPVVAHTITDFMRWAGDTDMVTLGSILGWILKVFGL